MQKSKLTKRQRKCLRGASSIVQLSLDKGYDIEATDRTYRGAYPVYDQAGRKLRDGLPFVRTS